ncbi:MAG: aldo/keto reductase [Candidatus Methanoperedenaceae archaeon]|nr:MAG: aldo/keto reductase [Candidatus Methanoperedenaceae archaeon]
MTLNNRLVLGTAQFGLDYGINNKRGKIPKREVFDILNIALDFGINTLDTAYAYGESEDVVGDFIKETGKEFKIVSKSPNCEACELERSLDFTLSKLGATSLYGYMIHTFSHYMKKPEIWNILEDLKSTGKIEKIGFSLYYPEELDYINRNKLKIDIIQVPYSIFDQRFSQLFRKLKKDGVEIYIRSVFLQGLVFKKSHDLDSFFLKIKDKLMALDQVSERSNIPVAALCLNFAFLTEYIDKIVVGVDSVNNLNEIIMSLKYIPEVEKIFSELASLREDDENMIVPTNWKVSAK